MELFAFSDKNFVLQPFYKGRVSEGIFYFLNRSFQAAIMFLFIVIHDPFH